ncbi:MAG TPA: hypothetical protein VGH98_14565 [Gemmatimonadaceae bacterium]|jgi:hypothetical protein
MHAIVVRYSTVIALLVAQGCVAARVGPGPSAGGTDWPQTLAHAEAAASERRYADADRLLAQFAAQHPGTPGATESAYWRGVLSLEPANQDGTPEMAIAFFDVYGKSPGALPHRLEADVLRHIAQKLQSSSQVIASAASSSGTATTASLPAADVKAKDAEIQRLKDELAKANDELERIKRRLTAPTKP